MIDIRPGIQDLVILLVTDIQIDGIHHHHLVTATVAEIGIGMVIVIAIPEEIEIDMEAIESDMEETVIVMEEIVIDMGVTEIVIQLLDILDTQVTLIVTHMEAIVMVVEAVMLTATDMVATEIVMVMIVIVGEMTADMEGGINMVRIVMAAEIDIRIVTDTAITIGMVEAAIGIYPEMIEGLVDTQVIGLAKTIDTVETDTGEAGLQENRATVIMAMIEMAEADGSLDQTVDLPADPMMARNMTECVDLFYPDLMVHHLMMVIADQFHLDQMVLFTIIIHQVNRMPRDAMRGTVLSKPVFDNAFAKIMYVAS